MPPTAYIECLLWNSAPSAFTSLISGGLKDRFDCPLILLFLDFSISSIELRALSSSSIVLVALALVSAVCVDCRSMPGTSMLYCCLMFCRWVMMSFAILSSFWLSCGSILSILDSPAVISLIFPKVLSLALSIAAFTFAVPCVSIRVAVCARVSADGRKDEPVTSVVGCRYIPENGDGVSRLPSLCTPSVSARALAASCPSRVWFCGFWFICSISPSRSL